MRIIWRLIIAALGLFNLVIGLGFLLAPARLAGAFFLAPIGSQGLATLRADFPGFFIGAAIFAIVAAWQADPRPLAVPLALLGIALIGRAIGLAIDGIGPAALPPMVVEAVMLTILGLARRNFAQPA